MNGLSKTMQRQKVRIRMVDCPSCKYYENGECRPTIFPPDKCDDYEESFEHHWEMMDDIEREEYMSEESEE